jgi:DNA-binding NarL/FixJ family response regulator
MKQSKTGKSSGNDKSRVLLVDDHPVVRHGISQLIDQEMDLAVCGEAEDERQALDAITRLHPDIVLVDISLKQGSGIDLIKDIRNRYPGLPVLVVSMHEESLYAERALRAGAHGYLTKQEAVEKILVAIRQILSGGIFVSEKMMSRVLTRMVDGKEATVESPLEKLSDREIEVFRLMGEGRSTRQIAEELHVSVKTVETHRAHIKQKLHLRTGAELLKHAVQWVQHR